jgi:hypothetical protein
LDSPDAQTVELELKKLGTWVAQLAELNATNKLGVSPYARLQQLSKQKQALLQKQAGKLDQAQADRFVEETLQVSSAIISETESETLRTLAQLGWSRDKIRALITKIKEIEISKLQEGDGINPAQLKSFQEASWLTFEEISKIEKTKASMVHFAVIQNCGMNGMTPQAFAVRPLPLDQALQGVKPGTSEPAVFYICPGMFLRAAAESTGPEMLAYVAGHELGHLIAPDQPVAGTLKIESEDVRSKIRALENDFEKAVTAAESECPRSKGCFVREDLLSHDFYLNGCDAEKVLKECRKDQASRAKVWASILPAAQARQEYITSVSRPKGDANLDSKFLDCLRKVDLNEMNDGPHQLKAYKKLTEKTPYEPFLSWYFANRENVIAQEAIYRDMENKLGRKPDSVDLHQDELVGDYWGTITLDALLNSLPDPYQRIRLASASLASLCPDIKRGQDLDYETHPNHEYRIRHILSHPGIRHSLGCNSEPIKPWCERQ